MECTLSDDKIKIAVTYKHERNTEFKICPHRFSQ